MDATSPGEVQTLRKQKRGVASTNAASLFRVPVLIAVTCYATEPAGDNDPIRSERTRDREVRADPSVAGRGRSAGAGLGKSSNKLATRTPAAAASHACPPACEGQRLLPFPVDRCGEGMKGQDGMTRAVALRCAHLWFRFRASEGASLRSSRLPASWPRL